MVSVSVNAYTGGVSKSGYYEGEGEARFKVGHRYVGGFKHGKMNGKGRYEWVDGIVFEGYFHDNVAEGHGVYTWPDGARYEGQIRRGLRHGEGTMRFADSHTVYVGEWKEGTRHGRGRLTFDADGEHYYDGEWVDDQKSGRGVFVYPSGSRYDGEWARDSKNGRGRVTWSAAAETYDGDWLDNLPHGRGTHVWERRGDKEDGHWFSTANSYEGDFVRGERHGVGVFRYATGAKYAGEWSRDLKHGEGVYTFEDGSVFRGRFELDRAVTTEGGPPFAPAGRLALDLSDVVAERADPDVVDAAAERVEHLLLRYNSELRALYRREAVRAVYRREAVRAAAAEGAKPPHPDDPEKAVPSSKAVPLTLAGFFAWARVSGVVDAQCTVATLARAVAPAWVEEPLLDTSPTRRENIGLDDVGVADSLDPNVSLVYREFAEALVRVAHAKFHRVEGLDARVARLIAEHALPSLAPNAVERLPWDEAMDEAATREVATDGRAHAAFASAAKARAKRYGSETRETPTTCDGRAFLAFLKRRGALADGDAEGTPVTYPEPEEEEREDEGEEEEKGEEEKGEEEKGEGGNAEADADAEAEADADAGTEADADAGTSTETSVSARLVLTTRAALAAFAAAVSPREYADAPDAAEEAEARREEERQARYEAGEPEPETTPETEEEAEARAAAEEDAEAARLARGLDCEATFPEFVEALARCATARGAEGRALAETFDAFLGEEGLKM